MNVNGFKISALHAKGAPGLRKDVQVRPGQAQALSLQSWVTLRNNLTFPAPLWPRSYEHLVSTHQLGVCWVHGTRVEVGIRGPHERIRRHSLCLHRAHLWLNAPT